jgi:hypothetical protein
MNAFYDKEPNELPVKPKDCTVPDDVLAVVLTVLRLSGAQVTPIAVEVAYSVAKDEVRHYRQS